MPRLIVEDTYGDEKVIEAENGKSLMVLMCENGVDDLQAQCGGSCSCATCHVWVDEAYASKLPPISEQENDALDCASDRRENSRLSCQLVMSDELDGIRVTVATI